MFLLLYEITNFQAQQRDVVAMLLLRGADPFVKNRDGRDAMELGIQSAMRMFMPEVSPQV